MNNNNTSKPIILVVDDIPENIDVLKGALMRDYTVRPAPNGLIALKAAHISPHPDLVLLDIMMPEMNGYEVCRRLKADEVTQHIPVIFVSAKSEEEDELEGLRLGAVDYITKPFSIPIIHARIKTHLALRSASLQLEEYNQRLLRERGLIAEIILKMRDADTFDGRNVRHLVSPVEETAGDMLFSIFTPNGRQFIMLGDFTGHGLSAAIGGPLVTHIFNDLAGHEASGSEIIHEINKHLCARLPTGIFFAAALIEISSDRQYAFVWNAALPEGLLIRQGGILDRFESALPPLGIVKELKIAAATHRVSLEKGDRFYLFSDGIIEAVNGAREVFGMERLETFLLEVASSGDSLDGLMTLLAEHVGSTTHEDDITLVEVRA
ncbi:MAG: SpoIIE family protein phosphatase [Magnetococcales bacterium]|nr:SpoIIE family protein phosphatase [Magnetococcales bacterium]